MLSVLGANSCIPYGNWTPLPRGIPDCLVAEDLPEAVEVFLLLLRVCCEALYHHLLLFLPGKDMLLRGTTITAGCKLKGAWKSCRGSMYYTWAGSAASSQVYKRTQACIVVSHLHPQRSCLIHSRCGSCRGGRWVRLSARCVLMSTHSGLLQGMRTIAFWPSPKECARSHSGPSKGNAHDRILAP